MNVSKQVILGVVVLLGGVGLLYATLSQILTTDAQQAKQIEKNDKIATKMEVQVPTQTASMVAVAVLDNASQTASVPFETVTTTKSSVSKQNNTQKTSIDNETLAQIQQSTPINADESEIDDTQYIDDMAVAVATNTTTKNVAPITNDKISTNSVQTTAHTTHKPKTTTQETNVKKSPTKVNNRPSTYQVQAGEGLIQLARRFDVPLDILVQVNHLDKEKPLNVGQTLKIPTISEVQKIQKQNAEKERQRQQEIARKKQEALQKQQEQQRYQEAKAKLKEARQVVKETKATGTFGVQVALASDEKNAQEVVKKLIEAGYKVKTSETTRGIRIVVGPETGKIAALALKDTLNSDPRIPVDNAWVLDWDK